jgi:plastocyanin
VSARGSLVVTEAAPAGGTLRGGVTACRPTPALRPVSRLEELAVRHRRTLGLVTVSAALLVGCQTVPEEAIEAAAYECPVGEEGCDVVQPVGPGGEMTVISSRESEFSFTVEDGIAVTGEIAVFFENEGTALHNAEVLGAAEGSGIPESGPGESDEDVWLLFPGEWTVICNIPGHRANGMETTVTVYATEEEAAEAEAAGEDQADDDMGAGGGGGGAGGGEETVLEPGADA